MNVSVRIGEPDGLREVVEMLYYSQTYTIPKETIYLDRFHWSDAASLK